jgi:hypothetical protein
MKSSRDLAASNALITASLALVLAAPLLGQVTLMVDATMDIYRAGAYDDGSDGVAPVVYTFSAQSFQTLTFSRVLGSWTAIACLPPYGPDGTTTGCPGIPATQHINNPIGTFSGYGSTDFAGGMVGIFLENGLPTSSPPPLQFYVSNNSDGGIPTDFKALSPKIGQVFFIGDGLTGTDAGTAQVFAIPATATHLYLGYVDSCDNTVPSCYSDNSGSMSATFQIKQHPLDWVEPSLSGAPPGRCCAGFAYDYATHSVLLFGGFTNPTVLGDTWTFQTEWTPSSPATSPPPRQGQGMAWDGAAGNIVLFGGNEGYVNEGPYLNDTWTWDGTTWTQQFPPVSPPARRFDNPSMTYDAATRTVLMFGGVGTSGGLGDTWTWDGVTKTWTQQFPAASPSPRRTALAYDDMNRTVVLFGGDNGCPAFTDTWTWNGSTWAQHFPTSFPSARSTPEMAYDDELGAVVLFGGYGGPGDNLNDTWIWNGENWAELHPANAPPGSWEAGMTYNPLIKGLFLFSGFGTTTLDDTWALVLK